MIIYHHLGVNGHNPDNFIPATGITPALRNIRSTCVYLNDRREEKDNTTHHEILSILLILTM